MYLVGANSLSLRESQLSQHSVNLAEASGNIGL
jgi:hypothetical protein